MLKTMRQTIFELHSVNLCILDIIFYCLQLQIIFNRVFLMLLCSFTGLSRMIRWILEFWKLISIALLLRFSQNHSLFVSISKLFKIFGKWMFSEFILFDLSISSKVFFNDLRQNILFFLFFHFQLITQTSQLDCCEVLLFRDFLQWRQTLFIQYKLSQKPLSFRTHIRF